MKEVVSFENMKKSDEYTCNNLIPSRELMYRATKILPQRGRGTARAVDEEVIYERSSES